MQVFITPIIFIGLSLGIHWMIWEVSQLRIINHISESQANKMTKATMVMGGTPQLQQLANRWNQQLKQTHHAQSAILTSAISKPTNTQKPTSIPLVKKPFNPSYQRLESVGSEKTPYQYNQAHQTSLLSQYGALLRYAIENTKRYESTALSNQLEGTVRLRITVQRSGELSKVELSESSNYSHLDDATRAMVKSIQRIDPAPQALQGDEFTFMIPVIYQIN